jgi:hypothetical protein
MAYLYRLGSLEATPRWQPLPEPVRSSPMSSAGKAFTLALSVGILAAHPCGAELVRADRVELQLPEGGMTLLRPPGSTSTFKHRLFDVTIEVQVEGRPYFDHWKPACTSAGRADPYAAEYQAGTLPRADQYLYSRISRFSKHGISTPKGSWLEHCLIFHSGELAAKLTISLPKSALERGEITAAEIEKILASARLTAASVEDRGTSDPRIVLEMPDDIVPAGLPDYTFNFEHNRLPLGINVRLGDPKTYERAKLLNEISAMDWEVGTLARTDEYFYYFLRPNTSAFVLGFRAEGMTAEIEVNVSKSSSHGGNITKEEIERVLASARVIPAGELDKK